MIPAQALTDYILQFLFPHEGETWENDPNDNGDKGDGVTPGNIGTRYGVDAASHPGVDIVHLTGPNALLIYQHEFYTGLGASMGWPLAVAFFDVQENCGETEAIKIVQSVLNLASDGLAGPKTMAALAACDPEATALQLPVMRDRFYETLGQEVPHDRQYVRGWENRDRDLRLWLQGHLSLATLS